MYLEDYICEINIKLRKLDDKKSIVMWGLGEYAEKICIYTEVLKYNINFFVDEKKKGVFLGHRIHCPKEIKWDEIDAVVISSFYSIEEIEKILREKYEYEGQIFKTSNNLRDKEFYKYDSRGINDIEPIWSDFLQKNRLFHNAFRKKKCFILGCGPSISDYELERIKDGVVFAVNDFYKMKRNIKIDHYVIADPAYLDGDVYYKYGRKLFNGLREMKKNNEKITCWFPIQFRDKMNMLGEKWKDGFYYLGERRWESRVNCDIDLTRRIFERYSVVQYCIQLAIYMGVQVIFLLGCEETGIISGLENYFDNVDFEHSFKMSDEDQDTMRQYNRNQGVLWLLDGFSKILKGYEEMDELCRENGIKLYTCASKTLIDGIDYCSFNDAVSM